MHNYFSFFSRLTRIIGSMYLLSHITTANAAEFSITIKDDSHNLTTNIPQHFMGTYSDHYDRVSDVITIRSDGTCVVSEQSCHWGVLMKNGAIFIEHKTPPNPDFEPYDNYIIYYVSDVTGIITKGTLNVSVSEKYGTFSQANFLRKNN